MSSSSPALQHTEGTCNVVIFGETGAGKSSLINLIAKTHTAPTSGEATGCTTEPHPYDVLILNNNLLTVKLFDTPGLGEGSQGKVPDEKARQILKELLQSLRNEVHLLMYCVRGVRATKRLCRNYDLIRSEVNGRVPIVLVATFLEDEEPDMEKWWRDSERSILDFGMTFAGHACVTTLTIDESDSDRLKQRRKQSYRTLCDLIEQCRLSKGVRPSMHKTIVLFGETGAGKSSLVNLMAGGEVADTSPDMQRCTMEWKEHIIDFGGDSYTVFDTVGLREPQLEVKGYLETVENAYQLIKTLEKRGGIDLLLFCFRADRVTATLQSNYRLFHEFLCDKKVPIVLAITNLEREQRMEDFWDRNHKTFKQYHIEVAGHACITAANRLDGRHRILYEESRITIRKLVQQFATDEQKKAWVGGDNQFVSLMGKLKGLLGENSHVKSKNLVSHLIKRCSISKDVAQELVSLIQKTNIATAT
ncbi:P-loop containing nucleoside triphosphate hydrolase protein [Suillus lakei]|nr:P-loop containing nucleoside triphosphate hydrolase protein [Suillus lakei]